MFQITLRRLLPMLVGAIALAGCQVTGKSTGYFNPYTIHVPVGYEDHPLFALQSDESTPVASGQHQKLIFNGGSIVYSQAREGQFTKWNYSAYTAERLLSSLGAQFPNAHSISPVQKHNFGMGTVFYVTFFYTENGEDGSCYKMGGFDGYFSDYYADSTELKSTINGLFCSTGKHTDMAEYVFSFLERLDMSSAEVPKTE